ncbi:MAG: sulfite exporter TauE/SafE family protein [Bacteroidia bacterium]|nr:sulfite exporter TauE/SafE family protein [Bacteroidia bacterium]
MIDNQTLLILLLAITAFLYASVGHGGASTYIALLTLFHISPIEIRPTALILNILISFISFLMYRKVCKFPTRLFWILIIASVPASFLGGKLLIDTSLYRKILGIILLFPVARFLGIIPTSDKQIIEPKVGLVLLIGLVIGFVSGLIGIGGGILLSPIVLLLGWVNMKEAAALSALFIFFNSIAGLAGSSLTSSIPSEYVLWYLPFTLAGGLAGAYVGAQRYNLRTLKYVLTTVLLIAAVKLIGI